MVGRKHVCALMGMGIDARYRKPNTSKRHPPHPIYPYLLRGLKIDRPNEVWAMDITYIPMARGFVYLAAVIDWPSRRVLAWRVWVTLDTMFCTGAVEEAMGRYASPGSSTPIRAASSPVTSSRAYSRMLISPSAWRARAAGDNVFGERLWKMIRYEEVYLKACDTVSHARRSLAIYIAFYNTRRPHSSLDRQRPIRSISTSRCLCSSQFAPSRQPLVQLGSTVQTSGATSAAVRLWGL